MFKFFYLYFLTKGGPLIVEDTPVRRSLAFSWIKLCWIGGMLPYVLLVASILGFTCTSDFGGGGSPFISYRQYISSVWKLRDGKIMWEISREIERLGKHLSLLVVSICCMRYGKGKKEGSL